MYIEQEEILKFDPLTFESKLLQRILSSGRQNTAKNSKQRTYNNGIIKENPQFAS